MTSTTQALHHRASLRAWESVLNLIVSLCPGCHAKVHRTKAVLSRMPRRRKQERWPYTPYQGSSFCPRFKCRDVAVRVLTAANSRSKSKIRVLSATRRPCGLRLLFEVPAPSRADLILRRAVFSVIAGLLRPREFARFTQASHNLGTASVNSKILPLLGKSQADLFLSRAHRWPPCFRTKMLQAGRWRSSV